MDIQSSDFEHEKAFASTKAIATYAVFDQYAAAMHLRGRFSAIQFEEIKNVFDRWRSIEAALAQALRKEE